MESKPDMWLRFGIVDGLDVLEELCIADRSENSTRPICDKQAG